MWTETLFNLAMEYSVLLRPRLLSGTFLAGGADLRIEETLPLAFPVMGALVRVPVWLSGIMQVLPRSQSRNQLNPLILVL